MAGKKANAKFVEVKAAVAKQRGWRILNFVLDSATFDRIAFVSRRDDDKDSGYQRNLSRQRAADIARYIDKENGCIPNSILVNLEMGASYDEKTQILRIPDQPKAAWVIDGQHRMFGLRQAKTAYDLVVTAFLDLDVAQQAKQFKIINSKQKGVPTRFYMT
jgi:DGQHR domain-containing protein